MIALHDSRNPEYRTPTGALPTGKYVTLRVHTDAERCWLRLWWDDRETLLPMRRAEDDKALFRRRLKLPAEPGLLWYYFVLEKGGRRYCFGSPPDGLGGEGQLYDHEPPSFQITVYDPAYETPRWMAEGVMYQIMPDRYCAVDPVEPPQGHLHKSWDEPPEHCVDEQSRDNCASDFFGGNLRGIASKLDYISRLGVSVIYLNPIFRARSNHKYDTADYGMIDPSFGDEADFEALCRQAKEKGIRVILDGVFSHTGSDSRYFNRYGHYEDIGAYQSKDSPYADWYTFNHWPDDYACWWGFDSLPNVKEMNPGYLDYIVTGKDPIVRRWMRRGASGWRLDVADELPMPFIREVRRAVKAQDPDAALIGEVWEDASRKITYGELRCYCLGDTLDSVMNYPLREGLIDFMNGQITAPELKRRLDSLYECYPPPFARSLMNLVGSHDKARVISRLSGEEPEHRRPEDRDCVPLTPEGYARGRERFIKIWRFLCALPGMPCLYYGDEAGLQGGDDPFCRGTYPWGHEDAGLIEAIREINLQRRKSRAAQWGDLNLTANGDDSITARRTFKGETLEVTLCRRDGDIQPSGQENKTENSGNA